MAHQSIVDYAIDELEQVACNIHNEEYDEALERIGYILVALKEQG